MAGGIETITDRRLFKNILDRFFYNGTSFVYSQNGNIEVKLINSEDGLVKLQMPLFPGEPKNCIVFTRHNPNDIFVFLKLCGQNSNDIFVFNPAKFQIVAAERKEVRKKMDYNGLDNLSTYITNLISDKMINKFLRGQESKLKRTKEIIENDNNKDFEYIKIYFCNEGNDDPRMKYLSETRNFFFIPDLQTGGEENISFLYYKNYIYDYDPYLKKHEELISEICMPILHESGIPYGYIQVNNTSPFNNSAALRVKKLSMQADEINWGNKLFFESGDKLLISDVSARGIGAVFKNGKYTPYYKKNSLVSFDMFLPEGKNISLLAEVKHLEMMQDKVIRVGFEIKDMDPAARNYYRDFISSLS